MANRLPVSQKKPLLKLDDRDQKIIKNAIYITSGVGIATGTFLIARHLIRKHTSLKEQSKALEQGTEAEMAKRLQQAFKNNGWLGTDEAAMRRVFLEIRSQQHFEKVVKSYRKISGGRSLIADLDSELKDTEYSEMVAILASKPYSDNETVDAKKLAYNWARRLHSGIHYHWLGMFPATDEEAIERVFQEIQSKADFQRIVQAYRELYASDLKDDLDGDLWAFNDLDWQKVIREKPT